MNLKYYLRGLGIGIVVSTLIVGIASNNRTDTPSDEEIRQRARELGMVEASGVLADEVPSKEVEEMTKPTTEPVEAETSKEAEMPAADDKAENVAEMPKETDGAVMESPAVKETAKPSEEAVKPTETPAPTPEVVVEESKAEATLQEVIITVKSGDGSYTVCKKLEEAGLVQSASAYDSYLYQHGYDKRIIAASHKIPAGASEEQIAKIITGKN